MNSTEIEKLIPSWILNSNNYYLAITDLEGKYIYVNPIFKIRFSFLATDFLGMPSQLTVHPDDIEKCNQASIECIMNPNKSISLQIRKPQMAGKDFYWTQWEFSLFKDNENKPLGILCIGNDITEMKRADRKQKEFAEKIESMVENITDGFYVLDRDWKVITMNQVAEDIFGISHGSFIGKIFWDVFPDSPKYSYPQKFKDAMDNNETSRFEDYHFSSERWFNVVAYPSSEGLTIFFRDITNERKLQQILIYSEQKLRAILDSTTDSNILINPDLKILSFSKSANDLAKKAFNREIEEMDSILDFIMSSDRSSFLQHIQKAFSGEVITLEKEVKFDKFTIWTEASFFPVYNSANEVIAVTYNSIDISKRKKEEQKVIKQNEKLKNIAWNQSHIVRRHVANILGLCNHINDQENLAGEDLAKYISYLFQSAQELDRIVHEIVSHTEEEIYNI